MHKLPGRVNFPDRHRIFRLQTRNRRDTGGGPEPLIELILQIVGHKGGPTERTRVPIVVHPTIHAAPVEDVPAVRQPPDLLPGLELV